jgi:CheY-specific phosphatase CheX
MNNSAEKILYRKAVLIFEELGFLMPCATSVECEEAMQTAMVSFKGPFSGLLYISVSSSLLPILSSNMMGEEENAPSLEHDALCEITNIICGNVLPALYGFKPVFHLDAPVLTQAPHLDTIDPTFKEVSRAHIGFDCGCADVVLFSNSDSIIMD